MSTSSVPRWSRYRLLLAAIACGAAAAALTVAAGWPYWRGEPALAAVNAFVAGAFVVSGVLLAGSPSLRRTGWMAVAAGLCWALTWLLGWDVGPLPALGLLANALFFVAFGWGVLLYPDGIPTGRLDWWAGALTTLAYGPLAALSILTSEPEWNGFDAGASWPTLAASEALFGAVSDVYLVVNPVLAAVFVALVGRHWARLYGLERSVLAPALVALSLVVIGLAVLSPTLDNRKPGHNADNIAEQGAALAVLPFALVLCELWRAVTVATSADRMLRPGGGPTTVTAVRDALRRVLRDDTVDLYFWLPDESRFVDVDGEPAEPDGDPGPAWRQPVSAPSGEMLALVTGRSVLRRGPAAFTGAALRAARLALQNAQLQVAIQAQVVETRAAQRRVEEAEAAERNRIARDLHDGVQQRLLALAMMVSAAEWSADDPGASETVFGDIRAGLLAANDEVRTIARGLDPEILRSRGLAGAVRAAAGRLTLPVDVEIALTGPGPYGDLAERTVYFAVSELLANVVKHAGAASARVRLSGGAQWLVVEVRDDGRGGAAEGTSGGLSGLRDRAEAAGGSVDLASPPGAGTTVRVTVPTAAAP
ncbi:sensor histidine kinase [Parafrankia elaeagni]|uniref:sensor histidine kinase n=1 Tax=Parafrankia elaeagni TaxID=222534 RepID=UPI000399C7CC|nr:histidine kinase [Parafrankia elaeagni]